MKRVKSVHADTLGLNTRTPFSSSAVSSFPQVKPLLLLTSYPPKSAEHHVQQMFSSSAVLTMTWLNPILGLKRDDPSHVYQLDGTPFPVSVTGVLRVEKSDYAMERIQATTHIWAPRGNSTHRALEIATRIRFDPLLQSDRLNRSDVATLVSELDELRQGDYKDWIEPLITHPIWDSVRVIASERPTCCLKRRVAGTFDLAYTSSVHGTVLRSALMAPPTAPLLSSVPTWLWKPPGAITTTWARRSGQRPAKPPSAGSTAVVSASWRGPPHGPVTRPRSVTLEAS